MIDCDDCLSMALAAVYAFCREQQQKRREGAFLAELPPRQVQVSESEALTPYDTMSVSKIQGGPASEALTHP